jgi:putative amide transporter protein
VAAIQGWVTCAIPAALLLLGLWGQQATISTIAFAAFAIVVFGGVYIAEQRRSVSVPAAEVEPAV